MAVYYVDPINGVASAAGTEAAPVKTIAQALALTNPYLVVLAPGIYREQVVDIDLYATRVHIYGRGTCIIDGESTRELIDLPDVSTLKFWNVRFRNPTGSSMMTKSTGGGSVYFYNCSFWYDTNPGSSVVARITASSAYTLRFFRCTFKNMTRISEFIPNAGIATNITVKDCIIDVTDTVDTIALESGAGPATTVTQAQNAGPDGTYTFTVNITTTAPPYTTGTFPDPDLSLNYGGANIASYRGNGTKSGNIGSAFHAVFGHDTYLTDSTAMDWRTSADAVLAVWRDPLDGTDWINDTLYYDGATKGNAIRVNDANGDHFEIDTLTLPGATTAAIISPVTKVPLRTGVTSKIRYLVAEKTEDTAPASGSKKVIDSTAGTAARMVQYRYSTTIFTQTAASPSWVDLDLTTDTQVSVTQTYYIQMREIMTIVGT